MVFRSAPRMVLMNASSYHLSSTLFDLDFDLSAAETFFRRFPFFLLLFVKKMCFQPFRVVNPPKVVRERATEEWCLEIAA